VRQFISIAVPIAALLLSACGQGNQYVEPPPPKVTVIKPVQQPVTRYLEATGNTAAVNSTDLVARVPGFIQQISQDDGKPVAMGTLLYTIEPEPYRVKVEQAKAAEAGAEATLKQAQQTLDRQADLLQRQTASQATYDQALATRDSAQASLDQARANTRLAQLNYDYTQVTAPFAGIVTARQVSLGQYVGGSATPTVLASIVQHDPIWVNFSISESDALRVRAELARRGVHSISDLKNVTVEVGLQSETGYPHKGTLDYVAPSVNQSTGTLAGRAILNNADRVLLPGYFVRVRIPGPQNTALLIADTALGSDQGGRYLLAVNKDNVVEQRKIEIGPLVDGMRVIEKGLQPDDRVIVSGLLRAIPGQKVDPQQQTASAPVQTAR